MGRKLKIAALFAASFFAAESRAVDAAALFGLGEKMFEPSFSYEGKAFKSARWSRSSKALFDCGDFSKTLETFASPDGKFAAEITVIKYKKYPFVEWKTTLRNLSETDETGFVDAYMPLAVAVRNDPVKCLASDGVQIRRFRGACTSLYDSRGEVFMLDRTPAGKATSMGCPSGYSSYEWLPYFGVDFDVMNGANFAIGWCAGWKADFSIDDKELRISAGVPKTHFKLRPRESVMMPSILVMFRKNTRVEDAQNIWRRFILEYKTPRGENGEIFTTPIWVGDGGNVKTEKFLRLAEAVGKSGAGIKMLGIDAGWYGGAHKPRNEKEPFGDWKEKVGDWRVNTNVHPNSLLPISRAFRKLGIKFSLWLEIERVRNGTPLFKYKNALFEIPGMPRTRLLNLGCDEGWKLAFETLCSAIEENGVDVWRIDSNLGTRIGEAFANADSKAPDRVGLAAAKHAEGLYRLYDELRKKYPSLQIDNCASGGRRLDYESMSRTFAIWRSDNQCLRNEGTAEANQMQNIYFSQWLPSLSGGGASVISDEYTRISSISTAFLVPAWFFSKEENLPFLKKYMSIAKRLCPLMLKDFYALSENPENLENWCAYQAHDAEKNSGAVAAFRRAGSPLDFLRVAPRAIDKNAVYTLVDKDGNTSEISGGQLADFKITLKNPRDCAVFFYSKTSDKKVQEQPQRQGDRQPRKIFSNRFRAR